VAITRVGELRRVFKGGESELLNNISRLAILYEDLRLEMKEFEKLQQTVMEEGQPDSDNRVPYFLRRSLATLVEFRGALTTIRKSAEFKLAEPNLTTLDARCILDADRFLQQNWTQIKDLRNEFAGHIQIGPIESTMKNLTNDVGKVTWNPDSAGWTVGIECDFAATLLAGVITSSLPVGSDVLGEFRKAVEVISDEFNHAQAAMVALVHAFLWDRFGS
jgi:hypothetical protein